MWPNPRFHFFVQCTWCQLYLSGNPAQVNVSKQLTGIHLAIVFWYVKPKHKNRKDVRCHLFTLFPNVISIPEFPGTSWISWNISYFLIFSLYSYVYWPETTCTYHHFKNCFLTAFLLDVFLRNFGIKCKN